MISENEMIANCQKRQDMHVLRWLKRVELKGEIGKEAGELCIIEGWIEFCPPRPEIGVKYNCFRLTVKGKAEVERIEKKYTVEMAD